MLGDINIRIAPTSTDGRLSTTGALNTPWAIYDSAYGQSAWSGLTNVSSSDPNVLIVRHSSVVVSYVVVAARLQGFPFSLC